MNLLEKLRSAIGNVFKKRIQINWVNFPDGFNSTSSSSYKYKTYALEGFAQNPAVYSCIEYIERASKAVKIQLMKNDEDVEPDDPAAQPILDLLKRPNPYQSIEEFISAWSIDMQIGGIAYIHMIGVGAEELGDIRRIKTSPQLWLLRPDLVTVKATDREVLYYTYRSPNTLTETRYEPEEIYFTRYPDPLNFFSGMPPMRAAARIIDAHNNSLTWWDTLVGNMGKLSGVLGLKGMQNANQDELARLESEWQKKYSGPQNVGKTAILPGDGFDYTDLGKSPSELDWLGSEAILTRRICTVFGVPSQLLGDPDTSKYSNYKEARHAFYTEKIIPDMRLFNSAANTWLMPLFGSEWEIRLDYSDIDALRDDENEKVNRLKTADWMTINEKRRDMNIEDEIDGGDEIYMPFNLVPLGEGAEIGESSRSIRGDNTALPHVHPNSLYPSESDRVYAVDRNERIRLKWDKEYYTTIRKFLSDQTERIVNALNNFESARSETHNIPTDFIFVEFVNNGENEKYAEAVSEMQMLLIIEFGQEAIEEFVKEGLLFDIENPSIQKFMADNLAQRSRLINETTADRMQKLINEGVQNNEGILKIRDRLLEKFGDLNQARARTIAQTEVGRASTAAKIEGYSQTGIEYKEWISARDDRVRDTHFEMDGQVVRLYEDFNSPSGASGPGPGMLGEAFEDCNCRCITAGLKNPEEAI